MTFDIGVVGVGCRVSGAVSFPVTAVGVTVDFFVKVNARIVPLACKSKLTEGMSKAFGVVALALALGVTAVDVLAIVL